ncbi:MAG: FKBP-type peptidyl-prolyl cis-trans isomerase [Planctomycetaceae bacterium]|nr:FKBP-type peptidyl-prolyl cis-trans isomerase [Planctomycetaceae bacterium]
MKRIGLSLLLATLLATPLAAQPATQPAAQTPAGKPAAAPASDPPQTLKDQASYAIGVNIAMNLKEQELDINPAMIARGLSDMLLEKKLALTDEQMEKAIEEFNKILQQQMAQRAAKAAQEGEAFLAENSKKEGVVVLPSGLQYKVLKKGEGPVPKATDTVRTHYHGTFLNGQVFDSSLERGEPAEFPVNRVIPGWTEALQLMHVGDKWQLFVPSKLAYGKRGTPDGAIPPDSTLVFEVELLEIVQ